MKKIIDKILGSFDTSTNSFSARKLTAFTAVMVAIYVTYTLPLEMRLHALYSWQLLALLCLGIITAEQVIKLRNGSTNTQPSSSTEP